MPAVYNAYTWVAMYDEAGKSNAVPMRQVTSPSQHGGNVNKTVGWVQFIDRAGIAHWYLPITTPPDQKHWPASGGQAYQDINGKVWWATTVSLAGD